MPILIFLFGLTLLAQAMCQASSNTDANAMLVGAWNTSFGTSFKPKPNCTTLHSMVVINLPYDYYVNTCDVELQSNTLLLVFGGFNFQLNPVIGAGTLEYTNQLQIYDVRTEEWYFYPPMQCAVVNSCITPRGGHTAGVLPESTLMILFGGVDNTRVYADTYVVNTNINVIDLQSMPDWGAISTAATPPARWGHAMLTMPAAIVVYGGFTGPLSKFSYM